MTKVKICGITNPEDAELSCRFGADALGFNFYAESSRYIRPYDARAIIELMPVTILTIGVFVDADLPAIASAMDISGIQAAQLHGSETPEFARMVQDELGIPVIKAVRVSPEVTLEGVLRYDVDSILLDAYSPHLHGGTGETFDWRIAREASGNFPRMYLAGGLSPSNVRSAISETLPFAVDACSSLESTAGKKDPDKLRQFIAEARRND